jgi:DNA-binding NarL/FixJ family response regulator
MLVNHHPPVAVRIPESADPGFAATSNDHRRGKCHPLDMAIRCLIVDDSEPFLRAARALLEREGISVVGVASNGDQAVRWSTELAPDVTLVDIDLGGESGFDVARRLMQDGGPVRSAVILISTHAEDDFADLIAESHALGFLPKSELSAAAIRDIIEQRGNGE